MTAEATTPSEDRRRDEALCRLLNTPSRNALNPTSRKPDADAHQENLRQAEAAADASGLIKRDPPGR